MERPDSPSTEQFELPLFPLNLVLYPGMLLPLHIFEERYQAMIGDCLEQKQPFGIVLIKEGQEVGVPAVPQKIGTTTRILEMQELPGGRMNILTRGERRFEVLELAQASPHLIGRVRHLGDEEGETNATGLAQIRADYESLLRRMALLSGSKTESLAVPDDPRALSFALAAKLVSCIDLPLETRQAWLASATAHDRLSQILPTLQKVNDALEREVQRRGLRPDLSLN